MCGASVSPSEDTNLKPSRRPPTPHLSTLYSPPEEFRSTVPREIMQPLLSCYRKEKRSGLDTGPLVIPDSHHDALCDDAMSWCHKKRGCIFLQTSRKVPWYHTRIERM